MHRIGMDLASGKDRSSLVIMDGNTVHMMIDQDTLNASRASRKADRQYIAKALVAIVSRHGAKVEQHQDHDSITVTFDLAGVGAMIHIDAVHGGSRSLIHWHNTLRPSRNFTARFCRHVGVCHIGRLYHKATSNAGDWYSLAMRLDAGLCLAVRGEAFEPL